KLRYRVAHGEGLSSRSGDCCRRSGGRAPDGDIACPQWPPPPRSSRRGVRRSTRPRRRRLYRCHVDCFRRHRPPQPDPRYHVCERGGSDSERVRALAKAFAATRVDAWASGDIVLDMWEKFVMIASLAGMNCLMRGSVGDIMATEDGECLMLELL